MIEQWLVKYAQFVDRWNVLMLIGALWCGWIGKQTVRETLGHRQVCKWAAKWGSGGRTTEGEML